ncbi:MAG: hypothetical protein AAGJ40_03520 [Planctomycetota bacterium]
MMGLTFGLIGFTFGISASNAVASAIARVDDLEERLDEAGLLEREPHQ